MQATRELDEHWMRRALELAARGEGLTRPNPPVGAVVVREGRVVGEGWHRRAGDWHAERIALAQAGELARGATLYVTLEPCSTQGRTPPCVPAILQAGIRRVVVATVDPNPRHRGRGVHWLRREGMAVEVGIGRAEARRLIEGFERWILTGRPWLTLKLATTLDGRIADFRGRSRWITGATARRWVHAERRRADAILVGVGTVIADDPSLWPRPAHGRRPFRVVLDTWARIPRTARLLHDEHRDQTLIFVGRECPAGRRRRLEQTGARVVAVRTDASGRLTVEAVLEELGQLGVLRVLCEGGGELAGTLIRERWVDELLWLIAAKVFGADGRPALAGRGWALEHAPQWRVVEVHTLGRDLGLRLRAAKG
jgi:diaminohydroxyphosphoribosylaminopyrimidine deaminase/5-amino-6-(5-phosphoribosylamino)uracil reductase